MVIKSCCKSNKKNKICKRKDNKTFFLPRRFTKKQCKKIKGFTMRSSCAPYKYCGGKSKKYIAIAKLSPNKNTKNVNGVVIFKQNSKNLSINYDINNLNDGFHGFHIHNCGDLREKCNSGCNHFNIYNKNHGSKKNINSHIGDLGNIKCKNKRCKGVIYTKKISIDQKKKNNIIGRMIIVHKKRDDLGRGNNLESKKTGNAGKRMACGIIGIKSI
tara:strand:- start:674 stop:1318 length:645 start_codon:yes stop_codon:yes gene_type:complete